jgi:tight adherence protein C
MTTFMATVHLIAGNCLTIRIGRALFGPIKTSILILALTTALISALNLWRIGQREDRGRRLALLPHGSLFQNVREQARDRAWYTSIVELIATTPIIGVKKQRQLLRTLFSAGIRQHGGLNALIASKVWCGVICLGASWVMFRWDRLATTSIIVECTVLFCALIFGWQLPEVGLSRLAARRRARLDSGLPDALDLLVTCAEAGLSLDQALREVARELGPSNRELAEELTIAADEMEILTDRGQALENLAQRAGVESFRGIASTLQQSSRFGTPLAASLRVLAGEMRTERLTRLEERIARLPVLLTIPLIAFILPALMIIISTPLVLRILDMLSGTLGRAPW